MTSDSEPVPYFLVGPPSRFELAPRFGEECLRRLGALTSAHGDRQRKHASYGLPSDAAHSVGECAASREEVCMGLECTCCLASPPRRESTDTGVLYRCHKRADGVFLHRERVHSVPWKETL